MLCVICSGADVVACLRLLLLVLIRRSYVSAHKGGCLRDVPSCVDVRVDAMLARAGLRTRVSLSLLIRLVSIQSLASRRSGKTLRLSVVGTALLCVVC